MNLLPLFSHLFFPLRFNNINWNINNNFPNITLQRTNEINGKISFCWIANDASWKSLTSGVYGDVQRVKILYNKKDSALIQMAEPHQAYLGKFTM